MRLATAPEEAVFALDFLNFARLGCECQAKREGEAPFYGLTEKAGSINIWALKEHTSHEAHISAQR